MRTMEKAVKSKSDVVGTATYSVFDNVQEAVDNLGEATVLDLINSQTRTNKMNEIRVRATGKPSKAALQSQAIAMITPEEFAEVHGDQPALENLIASKVAELQTEIDAAKAAEPATVEGDDDVEAPSSDEA